MVYTSLLSSLTISTHIKIYINKKEKNLYNARIWLAIAIFIDNVWENTEIYKLVFIYMWYSLPVFLSDVKHRLIVIF